MYLCEFGYSQASLRAGLEWSAVRDHPKRGVVMSRNELRLLEGIYNLENIL